MTNSQSGSVLIPANISSPLLKTITDAIIDRKGRSIDILDFSKLETAPARTFVICQGSSTSQVAAIADNIREEVRKNLSIKPYNYDGYRNSQWIVIDYGDLMVHVFLPEIREYYNIEDLWNDANIIRIPDLD